jgi:5-methyltetrahydrofolate--homocysteine methyltransferase
MHEEEVVVIAIRQAVIEGKDGEVRRLVEEALLAGRSPSDLLNAGLIAGMDVIGARFREREIFLPDVLLAARAMNAGLDVLRPRLEGSSTSSKGTVVIGTVEGDLHDIGKNLVGIMLRGAGFDVVDLGNSVAPASFVDAARTHRAAAVGMSALLTTTMPVMERAIDGLRAAGLGHVRTIVGGAPVSEEFARRIGADGYGYDAARAVEILKLWTR